MQATPLVWGGDVHRSPEQNPARTHGDPANLETNLETCEPLEAVFDTESSIARIILNYIKTTLVSCIWCPIPS